MKAGDMLRLNQKFFHTLTSIEESHAKISATGLEIFAKQTNDEYAFAGGIARKPL